MRTFPLSIALKNESPPVLAVLFISASKPNMEPSDEVTSPVVLIVETFIKFPLFKEATPSVKVIPPLIFPITPSSAIITFLK